MVDMSKYTAPKTDQLNSDDLVNRSITIKIIRVTGNEGEQPISIYYEGDGGKPYKPGLSMRRILRYIWGDRGEDYVGRSLTLYRQPDVKFGGLEVGGIRISHASHIDRAMTTALTASKANKKPFTVKPLAAQQEPEIPAELKAAGDKAASEGVTSYTSWKDSLSPDQKSAIRALHNNWAKDAKAADAAKIAEPPVDEEVPV